jgi:hypothetical protein
MDVPPSRETLEGECEKAEMIYPDYPRNHTPREALLLFSAL